MSCKNVAYMALFGGMSHIVDIACAWKHSKWTYGQLHQHRSPISVSLKSTQLVHLEEKLSLVVESEPLFVAHTTTRHLSTLN